jgi:O-antigen/teichoic acid export membrane protein
MYKFLQTIGVRIKSILAQSLFKNASYLIFGSAISSFFGFIFIIVATRLYSAESVGLSSAAISAIGLIALISEFGLGISLIHFLPNAGQNGNKLLNFCLTINFSISIIVAIVYISGLTIWSPDLVTIRQSLPLISVFLLFAISSALYPTLSNVFLATRNSKYIVITSIILGLFKIGTIIAISFIFNNIFGILFGTGIATIVIVVIILTYYIPKVQKGFTIKPTLKYYDTKELFKYSIGNFIGRFLLQMTPLILPLIVLNVLGAESNASFYVAWSIYAVLLIIPSSTFNSLFAESSNEKCVSYKNVISSIKFMLGLAIPAIIIVVIFAKYFLLLFGKSYSTEATSILRILVISIIPWGINYLYVSIARSSGQVRGLLIISGLSAVLSLILSYAFILKFDLLGIGIGYLAGQSICALIVGYLLNRTLVRES